MGKFAPTNQTVDDVIEGLKSQKKKEDAWKLVELCKKISKLDPVVWFPGIIGFGQFHYQYETGIEGDAPYLAFAPRQARISLYIDQDLPEREEMLSRLGKHKPAVGCVYVNKLEDVDFTVLEEIFKKLFDFVQTNQLD